MMLVLLSASIQCKTTHPAISPNEQMFLDTTGPFKIRGGRICSRISSHTINIHVNSQVLI